MSYEKHFQEIYGDVEYEPFDESHRSICPICKKSYTIQYQGQQRWPYWEEFKIIVGTNDYSGEFTDEDHTDFTFCEECFKTVGEFLHQRNRDVLKTKEQKKEIDKQDHPIEYGSERDFEYYRDYY